MIVFRQISCVCLIPLLAGCTLLGRREKLPTSFVRPHPAVADATLTPPLPSLDRLPSELALALFIWRTAPVDEGGEAGVLTPTQSRQARNLAQALRTARAKELVTAYTPLLELDPRDRLLFRPDRIDPRHSVEEARDLLLRLRKDTRDTLRARPTAHSGADLEGLLGSSRAASFAAWFARGILGVPVSTDSHLMLSNEDAIEEALTALKMKDDILAVLAEADSLAAAGAAEKAFRLTRHFEAQPEVAEAMQSIGDAETAPRLRQATGKLALAFVSAELEDWMAEVRGVARDENRSSGADAKRRREDKIGEVEKAIVALHRGCERDERLAGALREKRDALKHGLLELARARASLAEDELVRLVDARRAWEAFGVLTGRIEAIGATTADGEKVYCLADQRGDSVLPVPEAAVREALSPVFARVLPSAFDIYLRTAERQVSNFLRHGTSLALCAMLDAMVAGVDESKLPAPVRHRLSELTRRRRQSARFLAEKVARGRVIVQQFSSGLPGLGKAFANDVTAAIAETIQATGAERLVSVSTSNEVASPEDYVIAEGHIADFGADEVTEVETMRLEQRWGKIEKQASPSYGLPGAGGVVDSRPSQFRQVLSEHVINQRTIERIAHIRLTFRVRHQGAESFEEINEFFRRSFVQESSHPFRDTRHVRTVVTFDRSELHDEQPALALRTDRVWTPAEMLDWGRRKSLHRVGAMLVRRLRSCPLDLAARARAAASRGDWGEASNQWGFCHEYLAQTHHVASPAGEAEQERGDTPDAHDAAAAEAALEAALLRLRTTVFEEMVRATCRLVAEEAN